MKRRLLAVVLVVAGALALAGSAKGTTSGLADSREDTSPNADARGDLTFSGIDYRDGFIVTAASVAAPTNPSTDPNWDYDGTGILWSLDVNDNGAEDYVVYYGSTGGAVIDTANHVVCSIQRAYDGSKSPQYFAGFPASCIGHPTAVSISTLMNYETATTDAGDYLPNDQTYCCRVTETITSNTTTTSSSNSTSSTTSTTAPPTSSTTQVTSPASTSTTDPTASTSSSTTSTTVADTTSTTAAPATTVPTTTPTTLAPTTTSTTAANVVVAATSSTASSSETELRPGSRTTISGDGFAPNQSLTITLHSTPIALGTTTSDASGHFSAVVTIPLQAATGKHEIIVTGLGANGEQHAAVAPVQISGPGAGGLPRTGSDVDGMAIAGFVLLSLGVILAFASKPGLGSPMGDHFLK